MHDFSIRTVVVALCFACVFVSNSIADLLALHSERSPKLSDKLLGWFGGFYKVPDTHVLNAHTLDGYLFLRFLKISVVICLVGCLITWPVLFPVNITGGGGQEQLDLLTIGNVADSFWRYLAHAACAYVFFGACCCHCLLSTHY